MDLSHLVWALLSVISSCLLGTVIYFVRRLIDKTERTIDHVQTLNARIGELARLEKRLDAMESITSNLNAVIAKEFGTVHEALRWLRSKD